MSSWYENPQLFMCNATHRTCDGFNVYRCTKELSGSIHVSNLKRICSGVKKGRDFDALLAYLINFYVRSGYTTWRIVNCQGLAIIWERSTCGEVICSWSREPMNSPYYSLPGITPPVDAEKEALKKRVSDLEKQVSELTSKLKKCSSGLAEEPWKKSGDVPRNLVPFEDLDGLKIPRNTSLKIIKAPGALKFVEDNTTNVRASHFQGGLYLAAVNVQELMTPNKKEARFDPSIWGVYENAGTEYVARKF
ncbi:hypothetical protein MKW92_029619 [Papaver armeniacum]|nr:hypothetical protein MKW92_029619 [Papaver armeniacum]